jgi:outer membrane protein OmpA-like peptidoglycan-associated protein
VFISGMGEPDPVTASGGEQPVPVLTENTIFKPRMIVPDSVPAARTMAELLPEIPQLRPLYFVFDQDELTREDLQTIHTAARYARQGFAIVIEGHTDDLGSHTYNQQLSLKRAQRIREIMVQQTGLSADSIEVKALGEQFPAVPNASEAQRRLNRRVEIKVKGKE